MRKLSALAPVMIAFLLGSVDCLAQSATSETSSPVILPANTPVILRLKENLYKEGANTGQPLEFEVVEDVVANGLVAIQSGATVRGSIREINKVAKGSAKLLIDLGSVRTVTGEMVRLSGPGTTKDDPRRGNKPGLKDVPGLVSFAPEILPALPVIAPVLAVMELFPGEEGPPSQRRVDGRSCGRKCHPRPRKTEVRARADSIFGGIKRRTCVSSPFDSNSGAVRVVGSARRWTDS